MVESYRKSCHREQEMRFDCSPEEGETHIIGHAYGNNDIAKDVPNIPHLQVISLDNWEQTCVVVHTQVVLHWMTVNLVPTSKV